MTFLAAAFPPRHWLRWAAPAWVPRRLSCAAHLGGSVLRIPRGILALCGLCPFLPPFLPVSALRAPPESLLQVQVSTSSVLVQVSSTGLSILSLCHLLHSLSPPHTPLLMLDHLCHPPFSAYGILSPNLLLYFCSVTLSMASISSLYKVAHCLLPYPDLFFLRGLVAI